MRHRIIALLARFIRGPWTPLRLTGVTFGLMLLAVALTGGQRLYNYVDQDPTFCRSCHTMERAWAKWEVSEHKNITCHSCHESNPVESMEQVVQFALNRPSEVRKHARVNDEACENCHESGNHNWLQVADTAGHKVHAEEQGIACVKCHSVTIHSFQPPVQICLNCHNNQKVTMTKMAERYCLDCHTYLRENSPLRPTRETCLSCHEQQANSEVHWPADAPMQFQCSQCHQPHKQVAPEVNCQQCHQKTQLPALHQKTTHAGTDCVQCHKPHEWKVETREACTTCHQNKVEHNKPQACMTCHGFNKAKSSA